MMLTWLIPGCLYCVELLQYLSASDHLIVFFCSFGAKENMGKSGRDIQVMWRANLVLLSSLGLWLYCAHESLGNIWAITDCH